MSEYLFINSCNFIPVVFNFWPIFQGSVPMKLVRVWYHCKLFWSSTIWISCIRKYLCKIMFDSKENSPPKWNWYRRLWLYQFNVNVWYWNKLPNVLHFGPEKYLKEFENASLVHFFSFRNIWSRVKRQVWSRFGEKSGPNLSFPNISHTWF